MLKPKKQEKNPILPIDPVVEHKLLTFDEMLEQTRAGSSHLLLGNGFSMAYDPKRFSFTTLLESAVSAGILEKESELYQVFEKLKTADFETVMRAIDNSQIIVEVYKGDPALQKKLLEDCAALKEHLVKIITNNHPEKSTSLTDEQKKACVGFLNKFKNIYTLNYDLLMYWVSMHDEEGGFTDGFGDTDDSTDEDYVVYKNFGSHRVHYLHGALHYYDAGDKIIKKTFVRTDINLIDQVRQSLDKNIYPVFISEGNSEQKKTKILHSGYLNHCYKSLKAITGDLVIFGASLKANDQHILDAILEGKLKRIYFGVSRISSASHVRAAVDSYNAKSHKKHRKQLVLYDYKTVNVWGK